MAGSTPRLEVQDESVVQSATTVVVKRGRAKPDAMILSNATGKIAYAELARLDENDYSYLDEPLAILQVHGIRVASRWEAVSEDFEGHEYAWQARVESVQAFEERKSRATAESLIDRLSTEALWGSIAAGLAAFFLFAAVFYHAIGWYSMLRWVAFVAAIGLSVLAIRARSAVWILVFLPIAILFNPISPVYLTRSGWVAPDLLGAAAFIGYAIWSQRHHKAVATEMLAKLSPAK